MLIEPMAGRAYYYKKQRLKVVLSSEGNHCERCALQGDFICPFIRCSKGQRADGKSIHLELPKSRRLLHRPTF